jgi:Ca-activated chloride channel family protein
MRMTADGRVVEAQLKEREAARQEYDRAIEQGKRAAIAEEERPDVFTMRVGNIVAGERVSVALTLVGPLSYEDGEATFRLPLVVAPRYIPGTPTGSAVGDGWALDTDAVPDASRITPPVLLPGFPNPVRLGIEVDIDPAGLPLGEVRSSLHAVVGEGNHLHIQPGERADRDFILRLAYGAAEAESAALSLTPDAEGDEGTFRLTVLPPTSAAPARPRDVVLVLDRSGSMGGWKMVAARRAAARIVDTLTGSDQFAVLAFDDRVDHPTGLGPGLHPATDRNRFRAVEFLSSVDARGGTEMLVPLQAAAGLLRHSERDRVVVLVTDGQVGNEDQLLKWAKSALSGVRVHTVGIDQAVNAGLLGRLAAVGGGRSELVESEDRLDAAMDQIHRRIGAPVVSGLNLTPYGLNLIDDTVAPARLPDLFPGVPLVVTGRYRGPAAAAALEVSGRTRPGDAWSTRVAGTTVADSASTAVWARAHLRDLEDRYVTGEDLEQRIVAASLRFGVLCRFTAWIAIDERIVVENGEPHRVIQPVEPAAGWDMLQPRLEAAPRMMMAAFAPAPMMAAPPPPPSPQASPMRAAKRAPWFGGGGGRSRTRGGMDMPAEEADDLLTPPDPFQAVRDQAEAEAVRLRALTGAQEYERREALADLGTRLDVLARDLPGGDLVERIRDLVRDLAEDRLAGADVDALWQRTLALLDELAGTGSEDKGSKAFWKR